MSTWNERPDITETGTKTMNCCQMVAIGLAVAIAGVSAGCEDGGLFGPSTSVAGTRHGTFIFSNGTSEVTATLSNVGKDQIAGSFTGRRSGGLPGAGSGPDGGSIVGSVATGTSEWPTATLTFESIEYCHWTLTAVLDKDTMAGTWSTVSGCAVPSSGSATLVRS